MNHAYCIAKAPRYATDEEWLYNARLIVDAVQECQKTTK